MRLFDVLLKRCKGLLVLLTRISISFPSIVVFMFKILSITIIEYQEIILILEIDLNYSYFLA